MYNVDVKGSLQDFILYECDQCALCETYTARGDTQWANEVSYCGSLCAKADNAHYTVTLSNEVIEYVEPLKGTKAPVWLGL